MDPEKSAAQNGSLPLALNPVIADGEDMLSISIDPVLIVSLIVLVSHIRPLFHTIYIRNIAARERNNTIDFFIIWYQRINIILYIIPSQIQRSIVLEVLVLMDW